MVNYTKISYKNNSEKVVNMTVENKKNDKRKTANRNRKNDIHIFLDEDETKLLDSKCKDIGLNRSNYIRNFIIKGKVVVKHINFIDCYELITQFIKIGCNINQIARNVNQYGTVSKVDVDLLSEQVNILQSIFIDEILEFRSNKISEV